MSQVITLIPVKKIKFQGGKKGLASSVLDQLHDSISKEGLFNPIVVRPDHESPGYYQIVQGRHRYYVVAHMLKEESIECRVFAHMSEEEAELATLTENACRTHAKQIDRLLLLRRWQEVYKKHYPHLEGKKASGNSRWSKSNETEAKQKAIDGEEAQAADEAANASSSHVCNGHSGHCMAEGEATGETMVEIEVASQVGSEPETKAVEDQTFRDRVKDMTGMSDRTLSRNLRINTGLTEEQVNVLDAVGCTQMGMLKVIDCTPNDLARRGEIVNLVARGMEVEQAIADVLGVTTTKDAAGRIKEVSTIEKKAEPETDEAWFLRECGEFAGYLIDPDQYKSDAILFHQIADARNQFRKSIKKIVERYKKDRKHKPWGRFFWSLYKVINISYPNDWAICLDCGGRGMVDPGMECPKCKGSCYDLKTERY